jgi:hypothetical protein
MTGGGNINVGGSLSSEERICEIANYGSNLAS